MITLPVYVGIENEFQLMREERGRIAFHHVWDDLEKQYRHSSYRLYPTSVRTRYGNGRYCDEQDPEVCTPPVRVQKGFTRAAADLLYLARKDLLEFCSSDPTLSLIGYSTHWNVSDTCRDQTGGSYILPGDFMRALSVPLSLFTLTPLSCGINLRTKGGDYDARLELLGDYIEGEDQSRALLLLYAATSMNIRRNMERLPFLLSNKFSDDARKPNLVSFGRETAVLVEQQIPRNTFIDSRKEILISAQDYLEQYYRFFKQAVAQIGDEEEVRNLEDFIYGRKELEIDRHAKYAFINALKPLGVNGAPTNGYYNDHPALHLDPQYYQQERPLPNNLVRFLSEIATCQQDTKDVRKKKLAGRVSDLQWSSITIDSVFGNSDTSTEINGLHDLELLAEALSTTTSERVRKRLFDSVWRLEAIDFGHLYHILTNPEEDLSEANVKKKDLALFRNIA